MKAGEGHHEMITNKDLMLINDNEDDDEVSLKRLIYRNHNQNDN